MTNKQLTFAFFGNTYQLRKSTSLACALDYLRSRNERIIFDRKFRDFLSRDQLLDLSVVGINMGRLGFLADVLPDEVETALAAIINGDYTIERHTAIEIQTHGEDFDGCHYALNDIAVLKRDNASMISIHTCVDGSFLVTYQADGLVVCTPTGSTAYSLSNGGPIIVPQTSTLCLTPVAPHSLNVRPVVISDSSKVELQVESRSHNFLVAVDGRSYTMHEGTKVSIQKAPFSTMIVKPNGRKYFTSLREKMMWGVDKR